jgi:hypothetical protein
MDLMMAHVMMESMEQKKKEPHTNWKIPTRKKIR